MNRISEFLAAIAVATPVLLIGGCGGAGDEKTATGVPNQARTANASTSTSSQNPPADDKGTTAQKTGAGAGQEVTPKSGINPKDEPAVVKGEVKGGEAAKGPTPEDFLWQMADASKVQDEPLTVEVPLGLNQLIPNAVVPAANPLTKGKFELGRQLYFEPRVSKDSTVSCATCHNPEKGWTDGMPVSIGIKGQTGGRSAPTVINTAYGKTMFWDGRAPSLEGQAQGPIQNKIEMGDQSYEEIIQRLREIPGYREQFQKVFGTDVTLDGFAKAVATFERVAALSGNSKYDKYNTGNDTKALNDSEKRGMVLFGLSLNSADDFKTDVVRGKANCTACHAGFNFTDEQFHNLGTGWDAKANKFNDPGRLGVTPVGSKNPVDLGAFKTPTVRDAARTAPYMHDGSERTLEAVVDFYDKGGNPNPALDKNMKKLNLTAQEKADLVAFMKALTGDSRKVELPKLPEGKDGSAAPDPAKALTPPPSTTALREFHPRAAVR